MLSVLKNRPGFWHYPALQKILEQPLHIFGRFFYENIEIIGRAHKAVQRNCYAAGHRKINLGSREIDQQLFELGSENPETRRVLVLL